MSEVEEYLKGKITALRGEIAACERALAALEPSTEYVQLTGTKQTLADIISTGLSGRPLARKDIVTIVQAARPDTNEQTVSGTLNNMSKAGTVRLKNGKWGLVK